MRCCDAKSCLAVSIKSAVREQIEEFTPAKRIVAGDVNEAT